MEDVMVQKRKAKKTMSWVDALSPYEKEIYYMAMSYGGFVNAHAHLDRADTNHPRYWDHCGINPEEASGLSLKVKQEMTGELHKGPAYSSADLRRRIGKMIEKSIQFGAKRVDSFIDASSDIGLTAVEAAIEVQREFESEIEFRIGIQPIFGFKNHEIPERWETYRQAASLPQVAILGGLPEVDNYPDRIGFEEHCFLIIEEARRLGKEVHVHLDQKNSPSENGTEKFLRVVESIDQRIRAETLGRESIVKEGEPYIWVIHMISPSCYDEARFEKLMEALKKFNIGVIVCPRAAISMLQLRPMESHIHNSVARVLELVKNEIPVRLGTDNVSDIYVPTGDINMLREVAWMPDTFRYYVKKLWVKVACGIPLDNMDREMVGRSLYQTKKILGEIKS
jgi:cytosine/adenosine deaminase-related metal-dependent hydrolase